MPVSVESVTPISRCLRITVPYEQVEKTFEERINYIAKNTNIKGFRPGMAPMAYIRQHYGETAHQEALNEVVRKNLLVALQENELQPLDKPEVEIKTAIAGQPLEFTASFEIMPEVTEVHFSLKQVEKPVAPVVDKDIDLVLEQLRKQHVKWQEVHRPAQEKDRVIIDYYAIFEGKSDVANKVENFPLELGSRTMIPGFEEGLQGATAGEERTLYLAFPKDFPGKEKAGKPVEFVINVKQVYQADVPELNAEFIKKLGIANGTEAELKTQVRQSLEQERDRLVQQKVKEQVFDKLIEQNTLELPKALITREASRIHDEVYPYHKHDHEHQHSEEETAAFHDVAKKRVTLGLMIAAYGKKANITANTDRVNARIQELAAIYEKPEEVIAWLSSQERRAGIEAQVMEEQVIDKLLEGTAIIEKPMSFSELKGIRN